MNGDVQKIEALLFLAGEAVHIAELARLTQTSETKVRANLEILSTALAGHGLTVVRSASHAQLTTSKIVSEYLQQFLQGEATTLSAAAAETLAIIAYRGPITRLDVEAIRGVDCRRMVRQLLARGLIRKHRAGERLPTYSISEEFLQHVGITRREELPDFDKLQSIPLGPSI